MSRTLQMKTKIKADTKLTVVMGSQIFYWKSRAPSRGNFRWLADLDKDSLSLRKSLTFKTSDRKYVILAGLRHRDRIIKYNGSQW